MPSSTALRASATVGARATDAPAPVPPPTTDPAAPRASPAAHDVTVVGCGLSVARHLSREGEDAVRAARVVFHSAANPGAEALVRALNPHADVRCSEAHEYKLGMFRPAMYRRIAQAVLDAAAEGPGVVMLAPGSAVVVDQVTQHVLDGACALGLRVRVLPGISSIESVLAEVGYDVAGGLQVLLAHRLVLHGVELDASMAALVLQPAYFDSLHYAGAPRSVEGRFDALARQLARTLSQDAPMALVATPTEPGAPAGVLWFRLGALARLHRVISPRHTLFVPPERAAQADAAFATRASSWEQLLARVERDARGGVRQQSRGEVAAVDLDLPPELRAEAASLARRWSARPR